MFQFTREFIINDNGDGKGKLEGGVKFLAKKDASGNGTLYVDNMINIRAKDVNAIYKHPYEAEAKEKVVIAPAALRTTAIKKDEIVRLVITLGKIGQTTATFNDYYPDHSRHLFYETVASEDVDAAEKQKAIFTGLLKSVKHEKETLHGEKFVTVDKDLSGNLVIEALDCYTVVKEVSIVTLPQVKDTAGNVAKIGALLTGYEDWEAVLDWKRKEHTAADGTASGNVTLWRAKEGNGNTVQILKNMRLQTAANLNPYGLDMDERPLPQGKYDQYTVEIVTERRHIGHDVMGSVGTSLTTIVFYVLRGTISKAFADALIKLTGNIIVVPAKTPEDLAVGNMPKQVLAHAADVPSYTEEEWDSTESYDESSEE